MERLNGVVKWFSSQIGFGFIQPDGHDKDVFIHVSSLPKSGFGSLAEGNRVSFEMLTDRMGKLSAGNISVHGNYRIEKSAEDSIQIDPNFDFSFEKNDLEHEEQSRIRVLSVFEQALFQANRGNFDFLRYLKGEQFEQFCMEFLSEEGYRVEPHTGWNEPDGGVDFFATMRLKNGMRSTFVVQCKGTNRKITAELVRHISGIILPFGADGGIIMTTSTFTKSALEELEHIFLEVRKRDSEDLKRGLLAMNSKKFNQ